MIESSLRKIPAARPVGPAQMTVKGTSFLARKFLLLQDFGKQHGEGARAIEMFTAAVEAVPSLPHPILASTSIPMGPYLAFQDELRRRYFDDDPLAFYHFGEASAEWALTVGPYKRLMENKNFSTFATQGDVIYRNYYDVGAARTSLEADHVSFRIEGIPTPFRHVFLEYATLGYFKRALELVGSAKLLHRRIRGFSSHDPDVHYELYAPR